MSSVRDIVNYLESVAPFHLQEGYDNAGLIVGDPDMEVTGVLTCLDSTEDVIEEAISLGANVVVAHHPIIFSGLRQLRYETYIQRTVIAAIKNDIAIIAIHTNLDNVLSDGVNEKIAARLGLHDLEILRLKNPQDPESQIGSGLVGSIDPMPTMEFLQHLKTSMELQVIKHTALVKNTIQKVAICGGSGRFLLDDAIAREADIYITADVKYHEFFDTENKIILVDVGHYESEKYTVDLLFDLIRRNFSNFAAHKTKINTNPVNYL